MRIKEFCLLILSMVPLFILMAGLSQNSEVAQAAPLDIPPEVDFTEPLYFESLSPKGVKISTGNGQARTLGQNKLYLPLILNGDPVWENVADPGNWRTNYPTFEKFYSAAQCDDWTFAGANDGLYLLGNGIWQKQPVIPADKIVNGLVFTDENCEEVYATSFGSGLYHGKLNEGTSNWIWSQVNGPSIKASESAWALVYAASKLFLGSDDGIQYLELLAGQTAWQQTNVSGIVLGLAIDTSDQLLAAVWKQGVFETDPQNSAGAWNMLQLIPPGDENTNKVYQANRNASGMAVGTQERLYYFDLGVNNWLVPNPVEPTKKRTYAVLATENFLYAGQLGNDIWHSDNGGESWKSMPPLPSYESGAKDFQVRGFHVGTDEFLYAATSSGIWRWTGTP